MMVPLRWSSLPSHPVCLLIWWRLLLESLILLKEKMLMAYPSEFTHQWRKLYRGNLLWRWLLFFFILSYLSSFLYTYFSPFRPVTTCADSRPIYRSWRDQFYWEWMKLEWARFGRSEKRKKKTNKQIGWKKNWEKKSLVFLLKSA